MRKLKVAVIGGGYTGLVAAYELLKAGNEVDIFERSGELGGLAGGFKIEAKPLEKAYHHIFRTDKDIIALAKELGLEDKLKWHASSVAIYYEGKVYPFVTPVDLIKFTPLPFVDRIRAGMTALFLQKYKNWKKFTHVSAYAWMKKWGGPNVAKVIWEPLLKGKFDKFYDKVSMAWLWARIYVRGNSKAPGDTKEMLGYFDGGFEIFTNALKEKIEEKGGKIKLGVDIGSISEKEGRPSIVVDGKPFTYDKILATVPSHVFASLIRGSADNAYIDKLSSIDYLGAVVAVFSSTQEISKFYWHNINDLSAPFLVFVHHTRLIGKENYNGKYVYYIGTYVPHDHRFFNMSEDEIYMEWFNYLGKIFPSFDKEQVREKYLFKMKNAQHIVSLDYEDKIPGYETPLSNVYLANFSQIFPEDRGTNYAVREGKKVAGMMTE